MLLPYSAWSCKIQRKGYHEAIRTRGITVPYKPCGKDIMDLQLPNQLSAELFPSDNEARWSLN